MRWMHAIVSELYCPKSKERNTGFIQADDSTVAAGPLSGRIMGGDGGLECSEKSCRRFGDHPMRP
jgi:hypothetical protein